VLLRVCEYTLPERYFSTKNSVLVRLVFTGGIYSVYLYNTCNMLCVSQITCSPVPYVSFTLVLLFVSYMHIQCTIACPAQPYVYPLYIHLSFTALNSIIRPTKTHTHKTFILRRFSHYEAPFLCWGLLYAQRTQKQ